MTKRGELEFRCGHWWLCNSFHCL